MPLIQLQCDACGKRFEIIQKFFSDAVPEACRHCGKGPVHRLPRPPRSSSRDQGSTSPTTPRRVRPMARALRRRRRGKTLQTGERAKSEPGKSEAEKPTRARAIRPRSRVVEERVNLEVRDQEQRVDGTPESLPALNRSQPTAVLKFSVSEYQPERLGNSGGLRPRQTSALRNRACSRSADAVNLARVNRTPLGSAQAVGELDFTAAVTDSGFERRENVRREDVTADDGQVEGASSRRGFSTISMMRCTPWPGSVPSSMATTPSSRHPR